MRYTRFSVSKLLMAALTLLALAALVVAGVMAALVLPNAAAFVSAALIVWAAYVVISGCALHFKYERSSAPVLRKLRKLPAVRKKGELNEL